MSGAPARGSAAESAALDGLRGIAALAVVLSHTSKRGMPVVPYFDVSGAGRLGVWLFFVLSAFLLTRQMLKMESPLRAATVGPFLARRFFRIFPMFAVALLLDVALARVPSRAIMPAFTFQDAPDIFWTVPVEFQYYFLIPLVAALFMRLSLGICAMLTLAIAAAAVLVPLQRPVSWTYLSVFMFGSFSAVVHWPLLLSSPRCLPCSLFRR